VLKIEIVANKTIVTCATLVAAYSLTIYAQGAQSPSAKINPLSPRAPASGPPTSLGGHALSISDLTSFFDGLIPYAFEQGDIAGGEVAVVKRDRIVFAKGYGFADVGSREPISVDNTLFRPGSISKLFTWTAVMQLVQAHKLDLDQDVNAYLDFRIPDAFGKRSRCAN